MDMALTGVCSFRDGFTARAGRAIQEHTEPRDEARHRPARGSFSPVFTFPLERLHTSHPLLSLFIIYNCT